MEDQKEETEMTLNELSYQAAKRLLKIDPLNLNNEIAEHPVVLQEIGEKVMKLRSEKDTLELKLETTEATIAQEIRNVGGEKKLTEAAIKEMVLADPRRHALMEDYLQICEDYNIWNALYGAFQSRGYMLRDLAQLSTNVVTAPDNWTPANYLENRASMSRTRRPISQKEGV